jgi:hypothetical protein
VTDINIHSKYIDLALNRLEIGKYEDDQAELNIPKKVTELIT